MKKYLLLLIIIISSCTTTDNFYLNGDIKGLKKGTIVLSKSIKNSEIVLDSINLNGDSNFTLSCFLNEPEVLKIKLTNSGLNNDEIYFFANKGVTDFKTNLKRFVYEADFNGSLQQRKLDEFKKMMTKYNEENLNLIKNQIELYNNEDEMNIINQKLVNLKKREMFYIINFTINNSNSEVSPFIANKYLNDINIKYLDTIYKSLEESIKNSKYGLILKKKLTKEGN
ncbi:MAG: hypothetical protein ACI8PF_000663 [Flavobacteriaceae bacterium]|jgi:hypothetical protein